MQAEEQNRERERTSIIEILLFLVGRGRGGGGIGFKLGTHQTPQKSVIITRLYHLNEIILVHGPNVP